MISKCGRSQEDPSHSNGIPLPMEALSKAPFSMKRFRTLSTVSPPPQWLMKEAPPPLAYRLGLHVQS